MAERLDMPNRTNSSSYEWRRSLISHTAKFTWDELETNFPGFQMGLEKMGFTPTRKVMYTCMYKSDIPSVKYVLHKEKQDGTFDKVVLFLCIHNVEFLLRLNSHHYRSGPSSVLGIIQPFRDFFIAEYPKCQSLSLNLKPRKNESKLIYSKWNTDNPNFLSLSDRLPTDSKVFTVSFTLLMLKIRGILDNKR